MIFDLVFLLLGVILLAFGSDVLVGAASKIARIFGISELVIGLTIVAIGTSLPELASSITASRAGFGAIAVGNIVGANMADLALILGFSALIANIGIERDVFTKQCFIMISAMIAFYFLALNGTISFFEGIILVLLFFYYLAFLFKFRLRFKDVFLFPRALMKLFSFPPTIHSFESGFKKEISKQFFLLFVGFIGLYFGSRLLIGSAEGISLALGIKETIIGLTIVSFGTTMPELIVSITAMKKGAKDILVGNLLGSAIVNILLVAGIASLFGALPVSPISLFKSIPFMLVISALLFGFMHASSSFGKKHGLLFLGLYAVFLITIFLP